MICSQVPVYSKTLFKHVDVYISFVLQAENHPNVHQQGNG